MASFTEEQLQKIKKLFDYGFGARNISKIIGVTRHAIMSVYKQLGLDSKRKRVRFAYKTTEKCCRTCKETKLIDQFKKRMHRDRVRFESDCLLCAIDIQKSKSKNLYKMNKINRENLQNKTPEEKAKYLKEYQSNYQKNRRKNDPVFKLKTAISTAVFVMLKSNNSKKSSSCLKYLPFTIAELKTHIENLFEPWMNWNNRGIYKKFLWDDNDQSTWKWHVDHIIPQSNLPYTSMSDENFKICWSLDNLRPYSGKQNLLDGLNKIRHIKQ